MNMNLFIEMKEEMNHRTFFIFYSSFKNKQKISTK